MTHVKIIHRVKNRKCGWSRISEGKLGCIVKFSLYQSFESCKTLIAYPSVCVTGL